MKQGEERVVKHVVLQAGGESVWRENLSNNMCAWGMTCLT